MYIRATLSFGRLLTLSVLTLSLQVFAQTAGDFRSVASGNWNAVATWERFDGSSWQANFFPTNANAGVITIQSGHGVTNVANVTADQIVVAAGGTLATAATLTVANGTGVDLDVSGTLVALGGSSTVTLQSGTELTIRTGGLFVHSGTSGACVNNTSATVTFENNTRFLMQRPGATVPTATWNSGSTCEINYTNASTSRPAGLGQSFAHFYYNNTNLPSGGTDLANTLTNVGGNFTINAGVLPNSYEFKMFNSSGSGNSLYGGDITLNAGRLNWASAGGPYVWTIRGNLLINAGTTMDVSGSASSSYTFLLDSGGVQTYTCAGANTAVKLNWTVNSGTTLSLNNDLPLTSSGRTLTANGTVNVNGKTISADLLAGSGTVRNQGGGNGSLGLGAGGGNNTLGATPALLDGASGTLGLTKLGAGLLTITAPQTFSGGLVVSNGIVLVNNTTGSGTGGGAVTVYGGTLGGTGTINGPVTVQSGATLAAGASIGKLTINNSLTLAGNLAVEVDTSASPSNDLVVVTGTLTNAGTGTVTVTNLGPTLNTGDKFTLFSKPVQNGGDLIISGGGVSWINDLATDGSITVASAGCGTPIPLNVTPSVGSFLFSWTNGLFKLQAQTNNIGTGIVTNDSAWFDYPGGGSSPVTVTIDSGNGCVFFRLLKPCP
ncbi:MAG: hypothetical protein EPO07_00245 [Verrucomicrobia bacterium]|nr:MAG: hypothetical protein EPO07_00245 [Verrucomicrobiota bacterium]